MILESRILFGYHAVDDGTLLPARFRAGQPVTLIWCLTADAVLGRGQTAARPQGSFERRSTSSQTSDGYGLPVTRTPRRAILRPTLADRPRYERGEGFRTENLALLFEALAGLVSLTKVPLHRRAEKVNPRCSRVL